MEDSFILIYRNKNNDLCGRSLTRDGLGDEILLFDSTYTGDELENPEQSIEVLRMIDCDARNVIKEYKHSEVLCYPNLCILDLSIPVWKYLEDTVFTKETFESFVLKFNPKQ